MQQQRPPHPQQQQPQQSAGQFMPQQQQQQYQSSIPGGSYPQQQGNPQFRPQPNSMMMGQNQLNRPPFPQQAHPGMPPTQPLPQRPPVPGMQTGIHGYPQQQQPQQFQPNMPPQQLQRSASVGPREQQQNAQNSQWQQQQLMPRASSTGPDQQRPEWAQQQQQQQRQQISPMQQQPVVARPPYTQPPMNSPGQPVMPDSRPQFPQQQQFDPAMQSVTAGFQQMMTSPSPKVASSKRHYPGMPASNSVQSVVSPGYPVAPGMQPMPQMNPAATQSFQPPMTSNQQGMMPPPLPQHQFQPPPAGVPPVPNIQYPQQPQQYPGMRPPSQIPGMDQQPSADRRRISPDMIPSQDSVQQQDQEVWDRVVLIYNSGSRQTPPLASSEYIAVDGGHSTPRFIRATTYTVPTTGDIVASSKIPLGLVIQPLAELRSDEKPIDVVDFGEKGPVRCNRCKAYINPFVRWSHGGQKYICNICDLVNDVPPEYFANLDMNGNRVDIMNRPELRYGTVDLVATKSGMLKVATETIKEMLDLFPTEEDQPTPCKISIVTFDRSVHFYNLSPSLSQPQMMIVSDIDDIFVPLSEGFLVSPDDSRENVVKLLDQLPSMFSNSRISDACLGAAVQATSMALKLTGGRLIVFQTSLPTVGPGSLKNREDPKLFGTEKEKTLFAPQDNFYVKVAGECVENGIGIDLFLFPSAYIDIATVGAFSAVSGGETYMYPNFNVARDGFRFAEDLRRIFTRPFGFDAILRVRCGNGLRVTDHFGNFHMRNSTDVEFGIIDSEKALAVQFAHDSKLSENTDMSFQIALLYTSVFGKRLIRVLNISLPCTSQIGNNFRVAEMDAIINFQTKSAISRVINSNLAVIRDQITENAVQVLAAYRKFCAANNPPGQLILPESCKLYPLYAMCALKNRAFKAGVDVTSDFRMFEMRRIRDMNVQTSINYFYPRMFSVVDLPDESCEYSPALQRFVMPPYTRTSAEKVLDTGAYILENSSILIFWIGREVNPSFLQDVFGVRSVAEVDITLRALPVLENRRSQKICALLHHIQEEQRKGLYVQLQIIRQGDAFESQFRSLLLEDPEPNTMGYVEYLCHIHNQIQSINQD